MNTDNAFGLRPVCHINGSPYNGQSQEFYIPETDTDDIGPGDPLTLAGSADANGVPSVSKAASGDPILGVMTAVSRPLRDDPVFREASTARYILAVTDPNILFAIQEDSVGGALAATNVGQNAELAIGTVSGQGISQTELDSSTAATTVGHDLKIIRLLNREDNEIGDNAEWLVKINNHQYADGEAGV